MVQLSVGRPERALDGKTIDLRPPAKRVSPMSDHDGLDEVITIRGMRNCEQSDAIADQNFVKVRLAGSWLTNQQQVASSAPKPLQILLAAHEGWPFGAGSRGQCG